MQKKLILVTGANGQLGREIFRIADDFSFFKIIFTDIEQLDITNSRQVRTVVESLKPYAVVNCAAYTAVDKAESEPEIASLVNAGGPANLATACAMTGSLLIHISTDYVFGGDASQPYKEDHPVNPKGVYASTKAQGEQAVITSGSDYIIIRTSWLYSVFGNNFVKTMLRLGQEREELKVVNDQIGSPTNAFDLAKTILQILEHPMTNNHIREIFHYANDGSVSWFDFATEIMHYAKLGCRVQPIPSREYPSTVARPAYSVLDTTKIKSTFGIAIPQWRESLHKCLDELLKMEKN